MTVNTRIKVRPVVNSQIFSSDMIPEHAHTSSSILYRALPHRCNGVVQWTSDVLGAVYWSERVRRQPIRKRGARGTPGTRWHLWLHWLGPPPPDTQSEHTGTLQHTTFMTNLLTVNVEKHLCKAFYLTTVVRNSHCHTFWLPNAKIILIFNS